MDAKVGRLRDERTGRFVSQAAFRNLFHAIASITKDARNSIKRGDKPSPPGQPPRTRRRNRLRFALRYHVDKQRMRAISGPRASVVGKSAAVHEFGGSYKGDSYPARPFMLPALERAAPRFAGSFKGSIGG